jgi:hypothetical protein
MLLRIFLVCLKVLLNSMRVLVKKINFEIVIINQFRRTNCPAALCQPVSGVRTNS